MGIHYVGEMAMDSPKRILIDSISDGQIEWFKVNEAYDEVTIGYGEKGERYPVVQHLDKWKTLLEKQFPGNQEAIDKFFKILYDGQGIVGKLLILKELPFWLIQIIIKLGLHHLYSNAWRGVFSKTTKEVVEGLTKNKSLQTVFCYLWGDYGVIPKEGSFLVHAMGLRHYLKVCKIIPFQSILLSSK